MNIRRKISHFELLLLAVGVGVLAGTASAVFLAALQFVTDYRDVNRRLVWLLPLGGAFVGWIYSRFGKSVLRGTDFLLDEIHDPRRTVPLRMFPLVLVGTLVTHLFGGSAGREGTAVQMAGALSDGVNHRLKLSGSHRRVLLIAGLSAGFASVFGTPFAGSAFGLEVLTVGRPRKDDLLLPALMSIVAAFVGHFTTMAWGIEHTPYALNVVAPHEWSGYLCAVAAGIAFGLIGRAFAMTTHAASNLFTTKINHAPLRPFVGGAVLTTLVLVFELWRYVGLGLPVIVEALSAPVPARDFALKFLLTAITLGAGFKGGEVTPLFFIGATFGNSLGGVIPLPRELLAGMGFVAVFGGIANVPVAATIMAIELFGWDYAAFMLIACVTSYAVSGKKGIYRAQR